jgi:hypothetical protein
VYLVTLLVLCCGMRSESRGGPTPCRLADGDRMIQQQTPDRCLPPGRLPSDHPAGTCDEAIAEFPHVEIGNSGGLSYGIPPFAETNPQGITGAVKFVAAQSTGEIG